MKIVLHCLVFSIEAFIFHGVPGKFIWKQSGRAYPKQNGRAHAIFQQYDDSLMPVLLDNILFFAPIILFSLWQRNVCLENRLSFF